MLQHANMVPASWRRSQTPHAFFLFALLSFLLVQTAYAASAVIGLDIGTEYIKAALVKPGVPIDIVLTKDTKRKEAAAIGFKPSASRKQLAERLYGGDAIAVAPRFSSNVYPNLKPLLGAVADNEPAVGAYSQRFPALTITRAEDGSHVAFASSDKSQDAFTVEELLSMEIANIKQNAEAMAGKGYAVDHAVITVPAFYTVDERRAIELAAELAGLEVMSLVSDGLAVGLNYATSRKFPNVDEGERPEHHLVYDMGAGSTTASVLRFQARTLKNVGKVNKTTQEVNVIGTAWDRTLGGDILNQLIVDDMVEKFVESSSAKKAGIQAATVKDHGRTMAKLWREAERLRQVLSANTATTANLESLFEDIDFKYKLSRPDFETLAASYSSRIKPPITEALSGAKLELKDLDSIVLHGGMVRTPFVQRELESIVGDPAKLRTNVNADESAVFGAAFKAAGLSPSFRVKDIKSNDAANYAATLKWAVNGKERSQKIFVPTSQAGTAKQLPFTNTNDFTISVHQDIPAATDSETVERKIGHFKLANLTASISELVSKHGCDRDDIQKSVSARLNPVTGLPEISTGSLSCEVDENEKKGGVVDGVKGLFGFGSKKDQEPLLDDNTATRVTETVSSSDIASDAVSPSSTNSSMASSSPSAVPRKKTVIVNLAVEPTRTDLRQLSVDELASIRERLASFDLSDKTRRLREEAYNTLEAYTYRARDFLEEKGFIGVSTPAQRKTIEDLIASTNEWLHGEGSSAVTETIKERYSSLKALIDPVQKRKEEQQKRPAAVQSMQKTLDQVQSILKVMREQIDKGADAAASASSSALSAASSPTEAASATGDALDDLDDKPSSTSSSAAPTPSMFVSPYTEFDYESLLSQYDKAKEWLTEQLAAQETLSESDDPVLLSSDADSKTKQLNDALSRMLSKQVKSPKKSSKSKTSKSKTKSSKTSSSSAPTGSPTASESPAKFSHSEL